MSTDVKKDWVFSNPWFWMIAGVAMLALSWGEAFVQSQLETLDLQPLRFTLFALGLLAVAVAVRIRLDLKTTVRFTSTRRTHQFLMLFFLAQFLGSSVVLIASLFGWTWSPLRFGPALLAWLALFPLATASLEYLRQRRSMRGPPLPTEEAALCLVAAGVASILAWGSLFDPADPLDMDTLRTFFAVLAFVAFLGAGLVLVPQSTRRGVLSYLVVLHFGGIVSSTLSVPPNPTVVAQLWTRIYRPYLEFMYLTNAYHFYSPEPGPTTHLWFRLIYRTDDLTQWGTWLKVPYVDETGKHKHSTNLLYTRYLAMTENIVNTEGANFYEVTAEGASKPAAFFERRLRHAPKAGDAAARLGVELPDAENIIPFHPEVFQNAQYQPPSRQAADLLASYVRHVWRDYAHEFDGMTLNSIKLYRVVHTIPDPARFLRGNVEPNDPTLYRAIFMGEFNSEGRVVDREEPYLYWILPTFRTSPADPKSRIQCFARRHAGDRTWVRNETGTWVEP